MQKGLCTRLRVHPRCSTLTRKFCNGCGCLTQLIFAVSSLARLGALQGGEALGKLANEHAQALLHASHAVDHAPSAAVTQMEWERDIEWGTQQHGGMTASSESYSAKHRDAEGTGADGLPCAQQAQPALEDPQAASA